MTLPSPLTFRQVYRGPHWPRDVCMPACRPMRGGRAEASAPHDMVRCMLCNDIVNEPLESRARVLVFNLCTVGYLPCRHTLTGCCGSFYRSSDTVTTSATPPRLLLIVRNKHTGLSIMRHTKKWPTSWSHVYIYAHRRLWRAIKEVGLLSEDHLPQSTGQQLTNNIRGSNRQRAVLFDST